jgi:hypothetical protein
MTGLSNLPRRIPFVSKGVSATCGMNRASSSTSYHVRAFAALFTSGIILRNTRDSVFRKMKTWKREVFSVSGFM